MRNLIPSGASGHPLIHVDGLPGRRLLHWLRMDPKKLPRDFSTLVPSPDSNPDPSDRLLTTEALKSNLMWEPLAWEPLAWELLARNLPMTLDRVNPTLKNLSRAELLGSAAILKRGAGAFCSNEVEKSLGATPGARSAS
jgi:hypothetical protein